MARSRSKRRRQNTWVAVALISTVVIVTLAHDVNRISAQSSANRASIDKSFAALATTMTVDENHYGAAVAQLMSSGPTMSRADFGAAVLSLLDEGHSLSQRAAIFAHPQVAGGVQDTLIDVVNTRVTATTSMLNSIGTRLALPQVVRSHVDFGAVGRRLRLADAQWSHARQQFHRQSIHLHLPASVFALSSAPLASLATAIELAPSLQVHRSLSLDAVSVTPAPLPAPPGRWVLLASNSVVIGVVVHNQEFVDQGFILHVAISPSNAPTQLLRFAGTVGPYASTATQFDSLKFAPNEHARVKIWLTGSPVGPHGVGLRRYVVTVAPSPAK